FQANNDVLEEGDEGQNEEIQQIQESNNESEGEEDQEQNVIESGETSGEEDVEESSIGKRVTRSSNSKSKNKKIKIDLKGSKSKGKDYESDVEGNKRKKRLGIESSNRDNEGLNASSARKGGRVEYCSMCKAKFLVREGSMDDNGKGRILCPTCDKYMKKYEQAKQNRELKKQGVSVSSVSQLRKNMRAAANTAKINNGTGMKKTTRKKKVVKTEDGLLEIDLGIPSLQDLCVRVIGKHIKDVTSFGDISSDAMNKVCRIISKYRLLDNDTLQLFLTPTQEQRTDLVLYDCTKIDANGLLNIAQFCPYLTKLDLQFCGQMRDQVVEFYADRLHDLVELTLHGPYLVSDKAFGMLFSKLKSSLKKVRVSAAQFGLEAVEEMVKSCGKSLVELELTQCHRFDESCIDILVRHGMSSLTKLKLSDIQLHQHINPASLIQLLQKLGPTITDLDLSNCHSLVNDDVLLEGILTHCTSLTSLSLKNTSVTGAGLSTFFDSAGKNESSSFSLVHLDLGGVYDLDDKALISILRHSGSTLQYLSLHSADQFLTNNGLSAFSGTFISSTDEDNNSSKDTNNTGTNSSQLKTPSTVTLPTCKNLHTLNLSFVRSTDDSAISTLLSNCPSLSTIYVNGNPSVTSLAPARPGLLVIGRESDTL
ncbi:DNA repair protein rhp7, partial [Zancudomyces culisetae]